MLGSKVRWAILDCLLSSDKPLSAYSIARKRGIDVKTTYEVIKILEEVGVVKRVSKGKQALYRISDNELGKALAELIKAVKKHEENYNVWMSNTLKGKRIRIALAVSKTVNVKRDKPLSVNEAFKMLKRRANGELDALAKIARRKFFKMFEKIGEREYRMRE